MMERQSVDELDEVSLGETISNLWGALVRRRWFLIAPASLFAIVAAVVVMLLPDQYASEATLVVVQQRIAPKFVESTMNLGMSDAFYSISREILSRPRLMKIIDDLNLYPEKREKSVSPDRLADGMRKDIKVDPQDVTKFGEIISFKITYTARQPLVAQSVTGRLADLFIEENLRKRSNQAATTTRFLSDQIEAARQRLEEAEQKVRDYKVKNLEQLPQQEQSLLSNLTDLRLQFQSNGANLSRAQQQRNALASLLASQIARLQSEREGLLKKFTARHPEVVKKDELIQRANALSARLQSGSPAAVGAADGAGLDDPQVAQLRSQVEANLTELDLYTREQNRLKAEIVRYQTRLNLTPVREQELTEILRDYELYKDDYAKLLNKQLDAQLSATLEERNEGQQFRLVDPPTLPAKPTGPKRLLISLGALAGGLGLGLGLGLLLEAKDRSFRSEKQILRTFALPLIASIPSLRTAEETSRRRRRKVLEWCGGFVLLIAVVAAELYVFKNG